MEFFDKLREKADWVRRQTIALHGLAPETRLASSLSDVEIFVTLFYSGLMRYNAKNPLWEQRDRLIISKGHGAISMYPILADVGFFSPDELCGIGKAGSFLGVIPDTVIPGFETISGSLGHGIGVAAGTAVGLKRKNNGAKVFVVCGDGELNSGAMWEAIAFSAFHQLNNLAVIVDNNKMSMLGYQQQILKLEPLEEKFAAFGWKCVTVDGHDIQKVYAALNDFAKDQGCQPLAIIADTKKGKGVSRLENDELCHIKSLTAEEVDKLIN